MTFVRRHFALSRRGDDGATLRAHLEAAARQGSVSARAELAQQPTPGPLAYLWHWFLELHGRRGAGGMGPSPITWPDFDAWSRLTRRRVAPWEFDVLSRLDNEFFASTVEAK